MARYPTPVQQELSDEALDAALVRAPSDQYVIWNGRPCQMHQGSTRALAPPRCAVGNSLAEGGP